MSAFDDTTGDGLDHRGLYQKFLVTRVSDPESKHEGCRYFVLDPQHDPAARSALLAYAEASGSTRPELANDLMEWLAEFDTQDEQESVPRCPECGHAPHGQWCSNMASDSECSCTYAASQEYGA